MVIVASGTGPVAAGLAGGRYGYAETLSPSKGLGGAVDLPLVPLRVVSGALATDEILTSLVEPQRLVAVTAFADNPTISNCAPWVPEQAVRMLPANAEVILSLEPDAVFVTRHNRPETTALLRASGVRVYQLGRSNSFAQVLSDVLAVGVVLGEQAKAQRLVKQVRDRIAAVQAKVADRAKPRVLYYSQGYTSGSGTLIDEMIQRAGGLNVARELNLIGSRRLSTEMAIGLEPDVILLSEWSEHPDQQAPVDSALSNPLWQVIPAVQNGRVYAVRGAWITSVSHYGVLGLEQVARLLHPEGFDR